jgi:uncharacterized protein YpuA (DUF1002 family)
MSEILDKMELNVDADDIIKKTQVSKLESKDDAQKLGKEVLMGIGMDLTVKIVKNLYKAKKQVKELIRLLTGMTEEEVSKMNIKQIKEFFNELSKHEGFSDFLEQAGELTE